jgi:Flp pilus assembly protein TadG
MVHNRKQKKNGETGASLLEFAIAATVFLTVLFAVVEFGRALWVHNALSDAARRGARYAVMHKATDIEDVKKIVVYGDLTETTPLLENFSTGNVDVVYDGFKLDGGTVRVSVHDYDFQLILPLLVSSIRMPSYTTTLTGESVGLIPE